MKTKFKWTSVASVTTGGKPFFYNTNTTKGIVSVVWSRQLRGWNVYEAKGNKIVACCQTKDDAIYYVEKFYEQAAPEPKAKPVYEVKP